MAYYADYKIVDGMYFVRGTTPKGTVVSYGKTSVIALTNLMNKYGWRFQERVMFRLGNQTEDPIERDVTVRRNRCTEWWFQHRERKGVPDYRTPVEPETPAPVEEECEYTYEIEGDMLKVYKLTLEKSYKIKQDKPVERPYKPFVGCETLEIPTAPGQPIAMFNSNKGEDDVA